MLQPLRAIAAAAMPTVATFLQRWNLRFFATLEPHVVSVMKGTPLLEHPYGFFRLRNCKRIHL